MIKKLFSFAITAIIALSFTSCSKENELITDDDIKIKFEVGDMPSIGNATRSIKTQWEDGDQILLLIKVSGQVNDAIMLSQTVTLTKTASGWTATKNGDLQLNQEGKYYAIYHRGNVAVSSTTPLFPNYEGGEIFTSAKGGTSYTVTSGEVDFGKINLSIPEVWNKGVCQFSVPGLDNTKDWTLAISWEEGEFGDGYQGDVRFVTKEAFSFTNLDNGLECAGNIGGGSTGIYTGEDHIFWFAYSPDKTDDPCYYFQLSDGTNIYRYKVEGKVPEANKAYLLPAITEWTKLN